MQKAYASYHVVQLIGRFSWVPGVLVHVLYPLQPVSARLASVGATLVLSDVSQPVSYTTPPSYAASISPWPLFKWECFPEPAGGNHPAPLFQAATKRRKRPTVTS